MKKLLVILLLLFPVSCGDSYEDKKKFNIAKCADYLYAKQFKTHTVPPYGNLIWQIRPEYKINDLGGYFVLFRECEERYVKAPDSFMSLWGQIDFDKRNISAPLP